MVRVSSLTVQFRATYHHGGCDKLGNDEQLELVIDRKAVSASDDLEHMSGIQAAIEQVQCRAIHSVKGLLSDFFRDVTASSYLRSPIRAHRSKDWL